MFAGFATSRKASGRDGCMRCRYRGSTSVVESMIPRCRCGGAVHRRSTRLGNSQGSSGGRGSGRTVQSAGLDGAVGTRGCASAGGDAPWGESRQLQAVRPRFRYPVSTTPTKIRTSSWPLFRVAVPAIESSRVYDGDAIQRRGFPGAETGRPPSDGETLVYAS